MRRIVAKFLASDLVLTDPVHGTDDVPIPAVSSVELGLDPRLDALLRTDNAVIAKLLEIKPEVGNILGMKARDGKTEWVRGAITAWPDDRQRTARIFAHDDQLIDALRVAVPVEVYEVDESDPANVQVKPAKLTDWIRVRLRPNGTEYTSEGFPLAVFTTAISPTYRGQT